MNLERDYSPIAYERYVADHDAPEVKQRQPQQTQKQWSQARIDPLK